jgi:DNA topoisomerase-1
VRKLEELGIGRPSTFAPTISTIQKRLYVVKEDREGEERDYKLLHLRNGAIETAVKQEITGAERAKLFPSDIGMVVNDFLVEHFQKIMDYNFTANVELEFDAIAQGQKQWNKMIDEFYGPFHTSVKITEETSEKASGERMLGDDPETGKPVITRIGRYGPIIQIGDRDDEEKPRFASLRKNQSIESITFEEAMDLFKLPRTVGTYEDKELIAAIGRFGPYVKHDDKFYSIKEDDPMEISEERSIEVIEAKRKADRERVVKTYEENKEVQVLKGRYGIYISIGKNNYKIPKDLEPRDLTLEECLEIAANAPAKKKGRFTKKKS